MIGIDILEIKRIKQLPKERFYARVFTPAEIDYIVSKKDADETVAGLFCCKEAVLKALGCGIGNGTNFKQVEITHNEQGQPQANVFGECLQILKTMGESVFVSVSHSGTTAVAVAVIK